MGNGAGGLFSLLPRRPAGTGPPLVSSDPWTRLLGPRRGAARAAAVAESTDAAASPQPPTLLSRALAVLDELRSGVPPNAPVAEVSARSREVAAAYDIDAADESRDKQGSRFVARDPASGRALGFLYASRLAPASGWSFDFYLDADALVGRPRP